MANDDDTRQQPKFSKRTLDIIETSLAIEAEEAAAAGALGYMARALVQATMPHSKTPCTEFTRQNGAFSMTMVAPSKIGLPYGSLPRLLVAWLTTQAVRTKQREIALGATLGEFLAHLGEVPTGGRWGSIGRVRDQTTRLFSSSVFCSYTANQFDAGVSVTVADSYEFWWKPKSPEQMTLFGSYVRLGERFFDEVTTSPVPVDIRALRVLKKSPMALDIYCWLTYRLSYLRHPTVIPWPALETQFGADYSRSRDFPTAFKKRLRAVLAIYPHAHAVPTKVGLELRPSPTHVRRMERSPDGG